MIKISDYLRLIAVTIKKPDIEEALRVVINTPGWKQKVREWFNMNKKAGLGKGLAIPLSIAIMTLSQAYGAQTADELISRIEDDSAIKKIDTVKVDAMARMLPYPVTDREILLLKSGTVPFKVFKWSLEDKISKGIRKILPAIKNDPSMSNMDEEDLADLIVEGFLKKVDSDTSRTKSVVVKYLTQVAKSGDAKGTPKEILRNIAESTVLPALREALLDRSPRKV